MGVLAASDTELIRGVSLRPVRARGQPVPHPKRKVPVIFDLIRRLVIDGGVLPEVKLPLSSPRGQTATEQTMSLLSFY
jgi:hypothetical protein